MTVPLSTMKEFQDKRVRMRFDDDHECIATLLLASQDMDGSLHLVYDKVEWENEPHNAAITKDSALYMPGEALISIEEVPPTVIGF